VNDAAIVVRRQSSCLADIRKALILLPDFNYLRKTQKRFEFAASNLKCGPYQGCEAMKRNDRDAPNAPTYRYLTFTSGDLS
jgi:hypothetical protein